MGFLLLTVITVLMRAASAADHSAWTRSHQEYLSWKLKHAHRTVTFEVATPMERRLAQLCTREVDRSTSSYAFTSGYLAEVGLAIDVAAELEATVIRCEQLARQRGTVSHAGATVKRAQVRSNLPDELSGTLDAVQESLVNRVAALHGYRVHVEQLSVQLEARAALTQLESETDAVQLLLLDTAADEVAAEQLRVLSSEAGVWQQSIAATLAVLSRDVTVLTTGR